jgi:hypothetical protein
MKYLLTTGECTDKLEYYILDLFKLYFEVNPGEVPNSDIGFNNIFTNVNKKNIESEIKSRITSLVSLFRSRFTGVSINLTDIKLIDESTFNVVISVNSEVESYEISTGLY